MSGFLGHCLVLTAIVIQAWAEKNSVELETYYVDRNTGGQVYSLHEVTQLG